MRGSTQVSRYEAALARAHKACWDAQQIADERNDFGAVEDLVAVQRHLYVMVEDSLKGKKRPRHELQMFLSDPA